MRTELSFVFGLCAWFVLSVTGMVLFSHFGKEFWQLAIFILCILCQIPALYSAVIGKDKED